MYDHSVGSEFRRAVDGLGPAAIGGQEFLKRLMDTRPDDFKLSAVTNAHAYYRDRFFVFRIEIDGRSIILTPHYRNSIWDGTVDGSRALFDGPIYKLVAILSGFQDGWAAVEDDGIALRVSTPPEFFERLLGLIRGSEALNAAQ